MQDQKGCKKDNIRADEEQITAARTKQHEEEEKHTDIRPQMTKDKYIYINMYPRYLLIKESIDI